MKKILFILLFPFALIAQESPCMLVDTVYVTAKAKVLKSKDICFGIKQIVEEELSTKYCLSEAGIPVHVEVFYFGVPKSTLRIAGVEKTNQTTQIGIKLHIKACSTCSEIVYEGMGESSTEIRAIMIELKENSVPFAKMTVSNSVKQAVFEAVAKMP